MAPTLRLTPRTLNSSQLEDLGASGLSTIASASRSRGRTYFHVADSVKGHGRNSGSKSGSRSQPELRAMAMQPEDHLPNAFCKDTSERRTDDDFCGLSSIELSNIYMHNGKGRRHICHGQSKCAAVKTPSEPSLVSEPISASSEADHLGHRTKIEDERWKLMLEDDLKDDEPTGGATSHHLSRRKGRLGFGKKHYGEETKWVGMHKARAFNDPGGDDCYNHKGCASFLGPSKKQYGVKFQADDLFCDTIKDEEFHSRKHFVQEWEEIVHASEDTPCGVNGTQTDLHTKGFLGKSKHHFDGTLNVSNIPLRHEREPEEQPDPNDYNAYGLGHRGKRKYLIQNNLEPGCRHNLGRPEAKRMDIVRSSSVPVLERDLPPNQTPYWQDALPDEERASKMELVACSTGKEQDRHLNSKTRNFQDVQDNSWSCLTWTPRKVDQMTAARFVQGQDELHLVTDEQHREVEFRNSMGKCKRSFGNAHNKSDFRFDYNDDPMWKAEHYEIVKVHLDEKDVRKDEEETMNKEDGHRQKPNERALMWGHGHGRRKFPIKDHLDKDVDGECCFMSAVTRDANGILKGGARLGAVKHKKVEDHLDPTVAASDVPVFFLDPEGKSISFKPRHHVSMKDTVDELMACDRMSEDSNTFMVSGMRRNTDLCRPQSARRFPQKDFERTTPRSATPRAQRTSVAGARTPLKERPRWAK